MVAFLFTLIELSSLPVTVLKLWRSKCLRHAMSTSLWICVRAINLLGIVGTKGRIPKARDSILWYTEGTEVINEWIWLVIHGNNCTIHCCYPCLARAQWRSAIQVASGAYAPPVTKIRIIFLVCDFSECMYVWGFTRKTYWYVCQVIQARVV